MNSILPSNPTGTILQDRYRVEHILGQGGMGVVFRAFDLQSNLPVALKALRSEKSAENPELLKRFLREGEILRELDHPNIVRLLDAFEQDEVHYLVMDHVAGGDLNALIESGNLPDIPIILSIAIDIADALTRAHRLHILHRDIKPANVLLESSGTVRLTDFGIASLNTQTRLTETGSLIGTVAYLPPEACMGLELDERADIWSFGILLYELLLGETPFTADQPIAVMNAILRQELPDIQALRPEIPDDLADLLYRMLVKDRDGRIPSVRMVGAELEQLLKGRQPIVPNGYDGSLLESLTEGTSVFDTPTPNLDEARVRLPAQSTRFVGRKRELVEIVRLLNDPEIRLLTLLGAGGMGKTRLAIEAARAQAQNYLDGVVFVDLAPIDDTEQIPRVMAEALEISFNPEGSPEEQLIDYLYKKEMLLVLDNFEPHVEAASFLIKLLNNSDAVRLFITSRTRLDLSTEYVYELRGMSLTGEGTGDEMAPGDAVELFLMHARRIQPDFQLKDEDNTDINRICRQVEGMPLGIQLAASWIRTIPVRDILEELDRDLDFLAREQHDMPPRQRSMRAVFDYSWNLLPIAHKQAFKNLSIFRGGFTLHAAREVAGAGIRVLSSLVDQSLLHRAPSGRFSVHELMRQFGREKLKESKEVETSVAVSHSDYYCSLLQTWDHVLSSAKMLSAVAEVERESSNVETAWAYAVTNDRHGSLLKGVKGYGNYFDASGRWYEGLLYFRDTAKALQKHPDFAQYSPERIRLLIWLASWQVNLDINGRGGLVDANLVYSNLLEPAFNLMQHTCLANQDYREEEAFLRLQLGRIMKHLPGRLEEGKSHIEKCLSLYQQLANPLDISDALYEYHFFALGEDDFENAGLQLDQSLSQLPNPADPRRLNRLLNAQGFMARRRNQFDEAFDFFEQAAQNAKAVGYWGGIYYSRYMGIKLSWELGLFEQALGYSKEALELARKNTNLHRLYVCMALIMWTYTNAGMFEQALEQYQAIQEVQKVKKAAVFSILPVTGSHPLANLHLGRYDQVMMSNTIRHGGAESKGWVYLLRNQPKKAFEQTLNYTEKFAPMDYEIQPILAAVLAMALFKMGRKQKALQHLTQGIQISLEKHNILALFRLLPVAALVLSDTNDENQRMYALEIWGFSKRYPFVHRSILFAELFEQPLHAIGSKLQMAPANPGIKDEPGQEIWSITEGVLSRLSGIQDL